MWNNIEIALTESMLFPVEFRSPLLCGVSKGVANELPSGTVS